MSTDVAKTSDYPELFEMLNELAEITRGKSGDAFVMGLMDRILSVDATDFDAIFEAQSAGMISGKDFTNRPFIVRRSEDIDWNPSSQRNIDEGGFPFYAIAQIEEYGTAEQITLGCGGKSLTAVLWKLWKGGYFNDQPDGRALMITETAAGSGNSFLSLMPFKRPEPARAKK